jgi:hypothetical protein
MVAAVDEEEDAARAGELDEAVNEVDGGVGFTAAGGHLDKRAAFVGGFCYFPRSMPSPEELAREKIDALLQQCGWVLQKRSTINLSASRGITIREALLKDRDEVEHHVHAVAVFAEVIHVGFGQHIGFRQHNAVALTPLQEFPKHAQHIELLLWLSHVWSLGRDNERDRVHTKSGDACLDPKTHDLEYLSLYLGI